MQAANQIYPIGFKNNTHLRLYKIKKALIPWMFLLPGIVFTLILRYYTTYKGIVLAFYKYDLQNPPGEFVGFKNFEYLFSNNDYWIAWKNTIIFVILVLLLNFLIPIIQALLLEEIVKLRGIFSTIYILPAVIPVTINVVLWRWIFDPTYGIANYVLKLFGGQPQQWLSDMKMVKFCIIAPGIIGGGISVLLYLAAIVGISGDIKEAAQLDGCTGFKRMFFITLPNIKFIIMIQFILTTMSAFQLLDLPYQFTGGGPGNAATSVSVFIYRLFTRNFDYGQASAAAIPLMIVISIITYFQLKLDNQEKE